MAKKHHAITFSAGTGFGITGILAYQNNFGATIIELQKEVSSEPLFILTGGSEMIGGVPLSGVFDVYVDVKTSVRNWSFDPIALRLN